MTPCMRRDLGGLHNRVFQQIMVWQLRRRLDGRCEYPPLVEVMLLADLEEVEKYILRIHNTAAQYIMTRPIM